MCKWQGADRNLLGEEFKNARFFGDLLALSKPDKVKGTAVWICRGDRPGKRLSYPSQNVI